MRFTLAFIISILVTSPVFAQQVPSNDGQDYLKVGFSKFVIPTEEMPQVIPSFNFEFENGFEETKLGFMSAIYIGYRKESSYSFTSGNFLNFKVGHHFKASPFKISTRVGVEWGSPSTRYNFTDFKSPTSYKYVALEHNSNIPFANPRNDATLYPIAEVAFSRKYKSMVFESGMRVNILKFRIENYEVSGDKIHSDLRRTYEVAPSVYFNIGFGVL